MSNRYLRPVYKDIFNADFSYSSFGDRLKMQKTIYLLQELGVPVGNYGFSWYKHGPYSQALLDDAYCAGDSSSVSDSPCLSADNKGALERLKTHLRQPNDSNYDATAWSECMAFIQFIRQNMLPRTSSDEKILDMLENSKPHLNERRTNEKALLAVKTLFD